MGQRSERCVTEEDPWVETKPTRDGRGRQSRRGPRWNQSSRKGPCRSADRLHHKDWPQQASGRTSGRTRTRGAAFKPAHLRRAVFSRTGRSCLNADDGAGATALHGATTYRAGQGCLRQVRKASFSHFQTNHPATRPKHGAATVKTDKSWAWEASEGLASGGGEAKVLLR